MTTYVKNLSSHMPSKVPPKPQKKAPSGHRNRPSYDKRVDPLKPQVVNKVIDDLLRLFYYTFKGYSSGPHPWGSWARPQGPEYTPLRVTDHVGGASARVLIQQHLQRPQVKRRFLQTLWELRTLLHKVDPTGVAPIRKVKISPHE